MSFTFTLVIALQTCLFFLITTKVNWYMFAEKSGFFCCVVNAACVQFRDALLGRVNRHTLTAERLTVCPTSAEVCWCPEPAAELCLIGPCLLNFPPGSPRGKFACPSARRPPRCFEVFTRNSVKSNQGELPLVLHLHDAHCMHAELRGLLQ